jgi:2Fe-2S ferredoxin
MPTLVFLFGNGKPQRCATADAGETVMRAAVRAGIPGIDAECGGGCSCGTCHVYVAPDWLARLPKPQDEELAMLEFTQAPRTEASRLSCQLWVSDDIDGLVLTVP